MPALSENIIPNAEPTTSGPVIVVAVPDEVSNPYSFPQNIMPVPEPSAPAPIIAVAVPSEEPMSSQPENVMPVPEPTTPVPVIVVAIPMPSPNELPSSSPVPAIMVQSPPPNSLPTTLASSTVMSPEDQKLLEAYENLLFELLKPPSMAAPFEENTPNPVPKEPKSGSAPRLIKPKKTSSPRPSGSTQNVPETLEDFLYELLNPPTSTSPTIVTPSSVPTPPKVVTISSPGPTRSGTEEEEEKSSTKSDSKSNKTILGESRGLPKPAPQPILEEETAETESPSPPMKCDCSPADQSGSTLPDSDLFLNQNDYKVISFTSDGGQMISSSLEGPNGNIPVTCHCVPEGYSFVSDEEETESTEASSAEESSVEKEPSSVENISTDYWGSAVM